MSEWPRWLKTGLVALVVLVALVPHREPQIESDQLVRQLVDKEVWLLVGPQDPYLGVNPGAILKPRRPAPETDVELRELVVTRPLFDVVLDGILQNRHPSYRVVAHYARDGEPGCAVFTVQVSIFDQRWHAKSNNSRSCSLWW